MKSPHLNEQAMSEIVSILVRAKLSRNEWRELRSLALELNVSGSDAVGWAIRDFLAAHGRPTEGSVKA